MKKNKSLTLSQALKLYTGDSILKWILEWSGLALGVFLGCIAVIGVINGLEDGFDRVFENIADTPVLGVLVSVGNVFTIIIISNMTFERTLPGGKFFRSLKDGFNVYGKMRLALMISIFFIISIYTAIVYILNRAVFHFMANGTAVYISVFTFSLLAIGITNLIQTIKNNKARLVFGGMIFLLFIISGTLTIVSGNDNMGIVHIIAAVFSVVLIPVSHKLMLADYRKNRWNA